MRWWVRHSVLPFLRWRKLKRLCSSTQSTKTASRRWPGGNRRQFAKYSKSDFIMCHPIFLLLIGCAVHRHIPIEMDDAPLQQLHVKTTALSRSELRAQENNEHFISIHNSLLYKSFICSVRVCGWAPTTPSLSSLYVYLGHEISILFPASSRRAAFPFACIRSGVGTLHRRLLDKKLHARNGVRMRLLFCAKRISLTRQKQQ